ncbi:LecA/PA-IL family lectin [Pseudocitrobacter cyperus]|uniref:LecA/PA-IL family lectin n=1 Tax=Pseudocitrobacter cyperus TaxID=3112843 RepID=A0ABV0HF38_9ENTR
MSTNLIWSGTVDAKSPEGTATGITLKKGEIITILADGWAKNGEEAYALTAPQGRIPREGEKLALANPSLKARIGSEEHPVGNHKYRWVVPSDGPLSLIFVDGKNQYKDNSGEFSIKVHREAENVETAAPFEDLTNFEGDNWNNWQAGQAGHDLYLVDSSTRAVEFITHANKNHAGEILKKKLSGLTAGHKYTLSVKAARIIGKYEVPKLSLRVDGKDISAPVELTQANVWVTLSATFEAAGNSADLAVVSHVADSMGNDFRIRELKITG